MVSIPSNKPMNPAHVFAEHVQGLPSHRCFSSLPWARSTISTATALEDDDDYGPVEISQTTQRHKEGSQGLDLATTAEENVKFWVEEDDIGEF